MRALIYLRNNHVPIELVGLRDIEFNIATGALDLTWQDPRHRYYLEFVRRDEIAAIVKIRED